MMQELLERQCLVTSMKNIKIVVEYDGTDYCGWQRQNNAISIQQVIEEAIFSATDKNVIVNGSGRTDAGVHAMGQVANFAIDSSVPGEKFAHALNKFLPNDVTIVKSEEVPLDFHARFSAKRKTYRYLIFNRYHRPALYANYSEHVRGNLDVALIEQALRLLIGKHDFRAFMAAGTQMTNTVREIYSTSVERIDDNMIAFEVCGSGFLYNMVRIIAGTVIEIGLGRRAPECIKQALETGDRALLGYTGGATGLYLKSVEYPSEISKEKQRICEK